MVTKKEKNQKPVLFGLLLLLAIGFSLVGIAWGLSFNLSKFNLLKPLPRATSTPQTTAGAIFSLSPSTATKMVGEKLKVSILLKNIPEDISGIAIKINCSWEEDQIPIQATDVNPDKTGIQSETNQDLVNAGWQYPINKITVQEKGAAIDLASIYVSPEGFKVDKETNLANFYFKALSKTKSLSCNFEPSLTKLSTKTGEQILLEFKDGNYVILEIEK